MRGNIKNSQILERNEGKSKKGLSFVKILEQKGVALSSLFLEDFVIPKGK